MARGARELGGDALTAAAVVQLHGGPGFVGGPFIAPLHQGDHGWEELAIPDGTWGGAGRINTLADIVGYIVGDAEKGRVYAERRFAQRRALAG